MSNTSMKSGARDAEIALEVARIRTEHPYQGNYRAQMAALLEVMFFKFGERVGANRLAGLLAENGRSPSTSTAQDEINRFWEHVRTNAAIKIDRPDVPPFLLDMFANMAGKVWENSMTQASATFDAHRQEVEAQVRALQTTVESLTTQLAIARAGAEAALRDLQLANELRDELKSQLAAQTAAREAAEASARELGARLTQEQHTRSEEAVRLQSSLAEVKRALDAAGDEQRRLLTVGDEFKQQALRDRTLRLKAEEALAQISAELEPLRKQLQQAEIENSTLAGKLAAFQLQNEQLLEHKLHSQKRESSVAQRRKSKLSSRNRLRPT